MSKQEEILDSIPSNSSKRWDIIKTSDGKQRISQLCDRCCIKKIKCDGLPGGCSNCIKIGFFCKTTDKLTRSSFPKGYTKTLEKQVVELELENNRIKLELENFKNQQQQQQLKLIIHTNTENNLLNFVNKINDDDDFFNFTQSFQQKQGLKGDLLSFDQFKSNPITDFLQNEFQINCNSQDWYLQQQMYDENLIINDKVNFNYVLQKFIKPLLHKDKSTESILNNNKIDNLISKFFNNFNKLIPILDFKKFYNQYLNFFNKFDIENELNFKFNEIDKIFIIKLLILIKFNFNSGSIFNFDNNLNYKFFKFINFKKIIKEINFLEPDIDKLEIMLMLLNYMNSFEIISNDVNLIESSELNQWCYELLSMSLNYINVLGLNINTDELTFNIDNKESLIQYKFVRLKLYWNFRILLRSIKIRYNYTFKNLKLILEIHKPQSLENVIVLENDLNFTLEYLKLIRLIPIDFLDLKNFEMINIDNNLQQWKQNFIKTDFYQNDLQLSRLLLSIYYKYKFIIDKSCCNEIINTSFELLQDLLNYENKPKITRGRKKRNFNEMLEKTKFECKINLINQINSLTNFEKLLLNDKLNLLDNNFKSLLLIACLLGTDHTKISKIYQIFEIGLINKSPFEKKLLKKISKTTIHCKSIDVSKELNDIHESFAMPDSIPSPSSSLSSNADLSFKMSRDSSISTNSIFMSRTPSIKQQNLNFNKVKREDEITPQKIDEIEVESLFGNYQRENFDVAQYLYKDDEDLMRLNQTVLSISR